MADLQLRGKCKELAEEACEADPTLTLVCGWYDDPEWGAQEHWWAKREDGTIVDPTAGQFPMGGVAEWYREYDGLYPCWECAKDVPEDQLHGGRFCSYECYGRHVL